ncbi:nuclear transport factor 2 family protein [Streptomyces achromogenes]|uniref:nuclear transport factor 2 family protein n=1 Tax=Streptomyces achromogenes TaxID=67255 RepID=UPI0036F9BC01
MSEAARPSPPAREVFQRFIDGTLNNDWDAVADTYAENVVVEIPFAPPGVATTTQGREELRTRLRGAGKIFRFTGVDDLKVRETSDPEVIVAEYGLTGEIIQTGKEFSFTYIMVVTVRGGEIVHSRDYGNPLASAAALDRLDALFTQLTGKQCG